MTKVVTLKSYYVDGNVKHSKYISKIKDVEKLFNNAVFDAEFFAETAKGNVKIQRTETTLYINYLDVPNCSMIDVTRMII
jgi:hypothetical protein